MGSAPQKRLISLREISARRALLKHLAYPSGDCEYSLRVLGEALELGVEGIYFVGEERLEPLRLGKGYRGVVLLARIGGDDVVLKVLRTDAGIGSLLKEAEMTARVNEVGVGPRLLGSAPHLIALEYVVGEDMDSWLGGVEAERAPEVKLVLRRCFEQARRLDEAGIDHGELSDAKKHIKVSEGLKPVILDFGKASITRKPRNVTSLFSYVTHGPHSRKILQVLSIPKPPLEAVRNYKRAPTSENFDKLLQLLNLA